MLANQAILFAAGAAALERAAERDRAWLRVTALGLLPLGAAALAPISLPIFPSTFTAAYASALGVVPQIEKNRSAALPQWFANRLAWPKLVEDVARAYRALPVEDRAHALLFTPRYGEAVALELWGPSLGLPPVISNHNTYCLWSQSLLALQQASAPEAASSSVGIAPERLERWFERVETVAAFECAECVDWRRHRPILVARAPRVPLLQLWPELKHFE